jgi:hypothetical protein
MHNALVEVFARVRVNLRLLKGKIAGDGGWYVYNIKWNSWGEREAEPTGVFSQIVCDPNCAEGFELRQQ